MKASAEKSKKKNYTLPEFLVIILILFLMVVISKQKEKFDVVDVDQDEVIEENETEATDIVTEATETTALTTETTETTESSVPTTTTRLSSSHKISVPYISQEGVLPSGCEIISSVMLLRYYHYDISVDDFIDKYLDQEDYTVTDGKYYGPHPNEAFVGNPYQQDGLGCYAPVIQKALSRILTNEIALDTTGTSLDDLIRTYISNDQPVLIWASMNMIDIDDGFTYTIKSTGENFTWPANEHCLVLTGYDPDSYYFNDPYNSNGVKSFSKSIVNTRFKEMGMQSVAVVKK